MMPPWCCSLHTRWAIRCVLAVSPIVQLPISTPAQAIPQGPPRSALPIRVAARIRLIGAARAVCDPASGQPAARPAPHCALFPRRVLQPSRVTHHSCVDCNCLPKTAKTEGCGKSPRSAVYLAEVQMASPSPGLFRKLAPDADRWTRSPTPLRRRRRRSMRRAGAFARLCRVEADERLRSCRIAGKPRSGRSFISTLDQSDADIFRFPPSASRALCKPRSPFPLRWNWSCRIAPTRRHGMLSPIRVLIVMARVHAARLPQLELDSRFKVTYRHGRPRRGGDTLR